MHHRHSDRSGPIKQESEWKRGGESARPDGDEDFVTLAFINLFISQSPPQHPGDRYRVANDRKSSEREQQSP